MNFKHLPELDWKWGYPLSIMLMFVFSGAVLIYFRRRKWL
ncbi:MAG: Loki-CTERM sorting domain-containing protein [Paludibacter sp.]